MSIKIYYKWTEIPYTWDGLTLLWPEIYRIVEEVTEGYNLGIDVNAIEQNIQNLSVEKKKKLIKVLIMIGDKKFLQEKESSNIPKITINDIKTISNKYLKIEMK